MARNQERGADGRRLVDVVQLVSKRLVQVNERSLRCTVIRCVMWRGDQDELISGKVCPEIDGHLLRRAMPTMPETDETLTYVTCQRVPYCSQQYGTGLDTYNVPLLLFDHLGKESLQCPEVCNGVHGERPERYQHEERLECSTATYC